MPLPPSLVGVSIGEARFRERFGVSVLMIRRDDASGKAARLIPEGGTRFLPGDRLIVFGAREKIATLRATATEVPEPAPAGSNPHREV